jgi:hypothetical protein
MRSIDRKLTGIKSTVIACTLFLLWGQAGFPNPVTAINTIAGESVARDACVAFVEERNVFPNKQIKAGETWMKHNKRVVEIIASAPDNKSLETRLCVSGSSIIQIVPPIQEGFWL